MSAGSTTSLARRAQIRAGPAAVGPALTVAVALVVLPALGGAPVGDVLLYLLAEVLFALLPGCALYVALGQPGGGGALDAVAIGYATGLVLEVLAFVFTAALGARGALWAYPPLVLALCVPRLRQAWEQHERRARRPAAAGRASWALAAVIVGTAGLVSAGYFPFEALPGARGGVVLIPDLVFHLGVAAEALHHWPITDPKAAGTPLPYEVFVYAKLAAGAQVTGIGLPLILLRLYLLPLIAAVAALLFCAGRTLAGRAAAGVAAAALFLLVGQLGLDPRHPLLFFNTVFFSLYDSPTYTFGLVLFVAALTVLVAALTERRSAPGAWWLLALLLIGCSGAKASIVPDLLGGLAVLVVAAALRARRGPLRRRSLAALALTLVVFAASYAVIYHGGTGGLKANPPGSVREMDFSALLRGRLSNLPSPLFWLVAAPVGVAGFCAGTLAGVPASLRAAARGRRGASWLILGTLLASFLPFLVLTHKGGSQNFFTYYGLCAACLLSGWGIVRLVLASGVRPRRWLAGGAVWLAILLAAAILPYHLGAAPPGEAALLSLWLGLPAAALAALGVAAWRRPARRRALAAAAALLLVLAGALDTPLHVGQALLPPLLAGRTLHLQDAAGHRGLTSGLARGLAWVRAHLPVDAVIAVNNQYSDAARRSPDYYYYSAFGERRVFLEGWLDTIPDATLSDPLQTPFPQRLRLNDALFQQGSLGPLATMEHRYGVGYLLLDTAHGPLPQDLPRLGRVLFRDRAMILLRAAPVSSPR